MATIRRRHYSAKETYKRDDILQKRPIILRSLLIVGSSEKSAHYKIDFIKRLGESWQFVAEVLGWLVKLKDTGAVDVTACCIWNVISPIQKFSRWSSSLRLFFYVPLKRDQWDGEWRMRLKDTANAMGCTYIFNTADFREVGGWGRDPFSRNLMSPTPRRKWYLTTGRRAH